MNQEKHKIDAAQIERFLPLNIIPKRYHGELLERLIVSPFSEYQNILKHIPDSKLYHFLLNGYAEIRHSFENREKLSSDSPKCQYPLEEAVKEGGVIRAITPCEVIIVNREFVDELITRGQNEDYKIVHLDDGAPKNADLIDDTYNDDWTELFFQSSLARHLSPSVLQELFNKMEDIYVKADQVIISKESPGDFFYIIKEGYADVLVDTDSGYQRVELAPGDYFGDESLITRTQRNANVIMTSEGVLGRLDAKNFNRLIKHSLVITPTLEQFNKFENPIYLDVRLPQEFNHQHHFQCRNLPVNRIRQLMDSFKKDQIYIITPEGGHRSELAVYLLRQAGIEAYFMDEVLAKRALGLTLDSVQSA